MILKHFFILILSFNLACSTKPKIQLYQQTIEEKKISQAFGKNWVVSTQGRASSAAVQKIFEQGGNIIDAAIAASFVISVERPQSTGLGGGGFLIYLEAKTGKIYAIDFRERAPLKSKANMYLDEKGNIIPDKSLVGEYSVAVPGLVKGLIEIHSRFGTRPLDTLIEPAINLAQSGIPIYDYLDRALTEELATLKKFPSTKKIFLKKDGSAYKKGEFIVQNDLAKTLKKIALTKDKDFYFGSTAKAIVKSTAGHLTMQDFANYKVLWREPVVGQFKDYQIISMPPPSSGGTHVIQILQLLEEEYLKSSGFQSTQSLAKTAKAMQFAFLDRARYMGDPDYVRVPVKTLTSKEYTQAIRQSDAWKAPYTPADQLSDQWKPLNESSETTHFSIMDKEGNVVVSTQTINGWFGSGLVAEGTGVLLNNEMDDFSAKPGASNLFGAIGSTANSIQHGKTPLSSMSPTIVLKNEKPILALGAPGGTRIITCVANIILNYLEYELPLYESVAALRIHQQWKPDILRIETGFDEKTIQGLQKIGWKTESGRAGCAVMAVANQNGNLEAVSEPRDFGQALGQ